MKNDSCNMEFAVIDAERKNRTGYPEAVYCAGKTIEQSKKIITRMCEQAIPVLATGVQPELAERMCREKKDAHYDEISKTLTIGKTTDTPCGLVAVVCAGTSDLPVARQAAICAEFYGSKVLAVTDVGIAGIHRLFARIDEIRQANAIVAVAGMEGALAGVIAGLVSAPVIAVPTSVGYGAAFGGITALLGMLTSCSPGIAVVNIDNGFGAGYLANQINQGFCNNKEA
jgi:NCAIR mutase (PurE)-related protein